MDSACLFSAIAGNQKIDAEQGIISGVSVITMGECAGKHAGTWVDETTLSQLLELAKGFKDGVKVKLSQNKEHDGSVGQIIGTLKSFRIDGTVLRADLHLLKTDENFDKIIEMSAKMPECFGLSVVVPSEYEKIDKKQFLRPTDLFSVDLVEEPAANQNGLFSAKTTMSEIKYKDGKSGPHHEECECKECMAKHSKKHMSAFLASILGLAETATDAEIAAALKASGKPVDVTALTAKLTEHETQLAAFKTQADAAATAAKKAEIAGLVSEATAAGKVVPLTDDELLKMEIPTIKAMFSKLPAGQVKMSGTRKAEPPKDKDGKEIIFDTPEKRIEFCRAKQAEGAAALTAQFLADPSLKLSAFTTN